MAEFNLGEAFQNDPAFNQKLEGAIGGVPQFMQDKTKNDALAKAASDFTATATITPQGTRVSVDTSMEGFQQVAEAAKAYQGIKGEYDKMLAQNAQQQAQMRAHPFANTLAQIAASVAANDTNPLTRGIGQGAAKLNPTMQQLQGERMGMLGEQEKAVGGQLNALRAGMEQQRIGQQDKRLAIQDAHTMNTELSRIEGQGSKAAMAGEFDPATHYKQLVLMGQPEQVAKASAERLGKLNEDAKVGKALKEKLSEEKDDKRFKQQSDMQRQNEASREKAADLSWERRLAMQEQHDAAKGEAARAKEKELPKTVSEKMADISSARKSADELMVALNDPKVQKIMGPFRGRMTDVAASIGTLSKDDAQTVAKLRLQFANTVKTLGAGAYGYRVSERPFLLTFTEAMKNNPQQNIGNLKEWIDFYDTKEYGYKLAYPNADFDRFHPQKESEATPAASHGGDVWTPEKVEALRGGQ